MDKRKIEPFENLYMEYDKWFIENEVLYKDEIEAVGHFFPKDTSRYRMIEIGVGSGRFAQPFGIKEGLEPAKNISKLAEKRGIKIYRGFCEDIPFDNEIFDIVLMVTTICFLYDSEKAFSEIFRILKHNGNLITGFIDRESPIGRFYESIKEKNDFYRPASFYSTRDVLELYKKTGFKSIEIVQSLFKMPSEIVKQEGFLKGYGKGSFIVISGKKF